jgi:hypothetical protein
MSRDPTRSSHSASAEFTRHQLTLQVKENRSKYKHLDFKEQQKELGKEVCSTRSGACPGNHAYSLEQWKASSENPKNNV